MGRNQVLDIKEETSVPVGAGRLARAWRKLARRLTDAVQLHLDGPRPGEVLDGHLLPVTGWVCSPRERVRAVAVEFGCEIQRLEVRLPRPDVAAAHPSAVGAP